MHPSRKVRIYCSTGPMSMEVLCFKRMLGMSVDSQVQPCRRLRQRFRMCCWCGAGTNEVIYQAAAQ